MCDFTRALFRIHVVSHCAHYSNNDNEVIGSAIFNNFTAVSYVFYSYTALEYQELEFFSS